MGNPSDDIVRGARAYTQRAGIVPPRVDFANALITHTAQSRIADAYDRMPSFNPRAVPAFKQMAEETGRQFDHITKPRSRGGMGIDVHVQNTDAYDRYRELHDDVTGNHRIAVTDSAVHGGHPVFSNDQNNMFRAVHDVFGHVGANRGFDYDGEEGAFQKHSAMYSPLARTAMATETRGQNSSLYKNGDFQEQKIGILPSHMQGLQFGRTGGAEEIQASRERAIAGSRSQGIF